MHIGIFLHPYTLENKFEGAFNDFVRLHCPNKKSVTAILPFEKDRAERGAETRKSGSAA